MLDGRHEVADQIAVPIVRKVHDVGPATVAPPPLRRKPNTPSNCPSTTCSNWKMHFATGTKLLKITLQMAAALIRSI